MKKKSLFGILLTVCVATVSIAQNTIATNTVKVTPSSAPTITWYGFVRNDMNYDSRQNIFVREGQLDLYPKDIDMVNGKDYNKKSQLNLLGILTRFGAKISGPDAFKAKTTAVIEGDFFGQTDANIGLLRLRHGYAKMEWAGSSLTLGQTWYPLFIPECYPGVVNFNTGIPIAPFGWAAQIKYIAKLDKSWSLALTAYKPREFSVPSVNTTENINAPSMNAALPELNAHLQYKTDKFLFGAEADYNLLNPYTKFTSSSGTEINTEKVSAITLMAYTKIITKKLSVKASGILGQNTNHWVMMGGYFGYKATATSAEKYKPAKTNAAWIDVYGNGKIIVPGFFFGYSENVGADANATAAYGRAIGISGRGIKNILRISPRMEFISGKLKFGTELEFTTAKYGTRGNDGKVTGTTDNVTNTRFTFSTVYSF